MSSLEARLERLATWRVFWILLVLEVLTLGCINGLDFPLSVPFMVRTTGQPYLDMCSFCDAHRVYARLMSFGDVGRHYQMLLMATIDIAIPVTSFLFGVVGLKVLLRPMPSNLALAVPLAAFILDLAENACILWVTGCYPAHSDGIASLVGITSGLKFCAYSLTAAGIVVLGGWRLLQRGRARTTSLA